MRYRRLLNLLAICAGVVLAVMGLLSLAIVASGNVSQGHIGLTLNGIGLLLLAAPALALPYSTRIAKWLLLPFLAYFSALAIKFVFWPQAGVTPTLWVQGAVIAFVVLLFVRVLISRGGKSTGHGT